MSVLKQIKLGSSGLVVPIEGLGCMSMSGKVYGPADEKESIATIHRAFELGANFLDTSDAYGPLTNELLVGKAVAASRHKYIIASKFGFELNDEGVRTGRINGSPEYIRKSVEGSLKRLGTDYIDLYYLHRLDPATPIEDTVSAMAGLVRAGKLRYIGLSEVSAKTIRRAQAIHPVTAIQTEYSIFERGVELNGVMDTIRELGIGFVAYSPLGRGFLSADIKGVEELAADDFRRTDPRFQGENFIRNMKIVEKLRELAGARGITTSQLALAWVFAKNVVAIPGTTRIRHLEDNVEAARLRLTEAELDALEQIARIGGTSGNRYAEFGMSTIDK